jgi:hypothetical protein
LQSPLSVFLCFYHFHQLLPDCEEKALSLSLATILCFTHSVFNAMHHLLLTRQLLSDCEEQGFELVSEIGNETPRECAKLHLSQYSPPARRGLKI